MSEHHDEHSHHRRSHDGHHHQPNHDHCDPHIMMGQDEFDNEETANTWATDPMVIFFNEKLANVFFQKFQASLDPQQTSLLDFGCGTGHLTKRVCQNVASVTGVDLSPSMIEMYRKQEHPNSKAFCINMTEPHPCHLQGEQFDFIVSFYVLHHVEDPGKMVRVLSSYLKPGGTLVLGEFFTLESSHFFKPGQLVGWLREENLQSVTEEIALDLKLEEIPQSNLVKGNNNFTNFLTIYLVHGSKPL